MSAAVRTLSRIALNPCYGSIVSPLHAPAPPPATPTSEPNAALEIQDRLAAAFGILPADRRARVQAVLERSGQKAAAYWLQLFLAMGIASLGLVLGSTAVVIGAMLISPLMGPIVELGLGLAIGSPLLVMRSFARTALSILGVIASAAILTLALPFTEVTPEIAARTSPTVLDLLIAIFCAIAAAYAAIRPGSDTTSTAAGTAIGIALVPPLCVVGIGIGIGSARVSGGAALLFTANFCAIVFFAVLCFLVLGFNVVATGALEHDELERQGKGRVRQIAGALQFVFAWRYGPLVRVLMPLLLLAAVFVPLREALTEVTWQVHVRTEIQRILAELPGETVRTNISVERGAVSVRLVTVGHTDDVAKIHRNLVQRIAAAAGVVPVVDVVAVPDASALRDVVAIARAPEPPIETVRREPDANLLEKRIAESLTRSWPVEAGHLVAWHATLSAEETTALQVVHIGPALGSAGCALLGSALTAALGTAVLVREVAVNGEPVVAAPEGGLAWLTSALQVLDGVTDAAELHACIEAPIVKKGKVADEARTVVSALRASRALRSGRADLGDGPQWKVIATIGPCVGTEQAIDGGAPDGGAAR